METKDQNTANIEASENVGEAPTADSASTSGPDYESLRMMYDDVEAKLSDANEQMLRARAEVENVRRRGEREVEKARKFALEGFFQELLPVRDGMEMGIQAATGEVADATKLREGIELTLKMVDAAMAKFGLKEIDPLNSPFNPELHQAMAVQESDQQPPNTVIAVYQKGFVLNDRLIRPARVVVSKAPAAASDSGSHGGEKQT